MRKLIESKRMVELPIPSREINIIELSDNITHNDLKHVMERFPNCAVSTKHGKTLLVCGALYKAYAEKKK